MAVESSYVRPDRPFTRPPRDIDGVACRFTDDRRSTKPDFGFDWRAIRGDCHRVRARGAQKRVLNSVVGNNRPGNRFIVSPIAASAMGSPLSSTLHTQQFQDALFILGGIGGFLFITGFTGYGNFATTLPGVILLALTGYLGFRLSRSMN